jgi:hypothetical protein
VINERLPHSDAYEQFETSKDVGYDEWHEGIGYDLEAFAAMTPQERDAAAVDVRAMNDPDRRDLEVLGAHGSRESIEHLRHLLTHPAIETRAHALRVLIDRGHTPGAVPDVQLAHVLDAIIDDDDGLTPALLIAQRHAGPMSKLALLRGAQSGPAIALHFASALLDLAGVSEDAAFGPKFRPVLLRLLPDNAAADRNAAFDEICRVLRIDPASIPKAGSGNEIAWAEKMWPRASEGGD